MRREVICYQWLCERVLYISMYPRIKLLRNCLTFLGVSETLHDSHLKEFDYDQLQNNSHNQSSDGRQSPRISSSARPTHLQRQTVDFQKNNVPALQVFDTHVHY